MTPSHSPLAVRKQSPGGMCKKPDVCLFDAGCYGFAIVEEKGSNIVLLAQRCSQGQPVHFLHCEDRQDPAQHHTALQAGLRGASGSLITGPFFRRRLHAHAFQLATEMQETLLSIASGYSANRSPNRPVSSVAVFSVPFLPVLPLS